MRLSTKVWEQTLVRSTLPLSLSTELEAWDGHGIHLLLEHVNQFQAVSPNFSSEGRFQFLTWLKEAVMTLDGPNKQHVFYTCTGADVVNDQIAIF